MIKVGGTPGAKPAAGRLTEEDLLSVLPTRGPGREVRVGVFVLLGILAFFTALFTMTDVGTFRGRYYATTVVQDAGGVRRGDPVQMRGVNIGRVIRFNMVPEGVAVTMELQGEYEVPADSRAQLKSNGLLGGMVAEIIPGRSPESIEDGAVLPGSTEGGMMDAAAGLGTQADQVLGRAQALLSEETVGAVGESALEMRALLAQLTALTNEQRAELNGLTSSLRRSAAEVEQATTGAQLEQALARVDAITLQMDQATASLNRSTGSLETVLARLERGEGTLGKLSTDPSLYDNMNRAATSMNELAEAIRADPSKYLSIKVF